MEEAVFGLIGLIGGILLSKLLEQLVDKARRDQRQKDMVVALHAEISAGSTAAEEQTSLEETVYLMEDEYPFGPSDRTDFVFSSLKSDISVLPQAVIHVVVRYYRLAEQSNLLIDDLKHPLYKEQPPTSRKKYAENIIRALSDQEAAAREALRELERFLAGHEIPVPPRVRAESDQGANGSKHQGSPSRLHI